MSVLEFNPYALLEQNAAGSAKLAKPAKVIPPPLLRLASLATLAEVRANSLSAVWTATDWQEFYDERAGVAEYDGGMSREKAEWQAYEACIVQWLNTHPQPQPNQELCPHCGKANGAPGISCIPVLSGGGHLWLHSNCHTPWMQRRRQQAIAALAGMGIKNEATHA